MKRLRQNIRAPRSDDSFGRGMEIALTVALFFGIGWGLDHWLGTTPIFMITLTVFAVVGFFITLKYRYDEAMTQLEAERAARTRAAGTQAGRAR